MMNGWRLWVDINISNGWVWSGRLWKKSSKAVTNHTLINIHGGCNDSHIWRVTINAFCQTWEQNPGTWTPDGLRWEEKAPVVLPEWWGAEGETFLHNKNHHKSMPLCNTQMFLSIFGHAAVHSLPSAPAADGIHLPKFFRQPELLFRVIEMEWAKLCTSFWKRRWIKFTTATASFPEFGMKQYCWSPWPHSLLTS